MSNKICACIVKMGYTKYMEEFKQELQALMDKYAIALVPIPCYYQDEKGHFHTGAEIKMVPIPKPSAKSDEVVTPPTDTPPAPIIQSE